MALIEHLREAVDAVREEMEAEYGGHPLWPVFRDAYEGMTRAIDREILSALVGAWYKKQAEKGLESAAVRNTVKLLAEALWKALEEVYSVPEARLERVDFRSVDWKPLLERLRGFKKEDKEEIKDAIAEEIGRWAGVSPKAIERAVEQTIEYASRELEERISELKRALETVKEIDKKEYERMLERLEKELLPRARRRTAKASREVELGELRAFIATATELLKTVKEAMEEFKKAAEELRRAAAERPPARPEAAPGVRVSGETHGETLYLRMLAGEFFAAGGGYDPLTGEFLAPLRAVWSIVKRTYTALPEMLRVCKMWLALNRVLYNRVFGFGWEFKRIEEDREWLDRIDRAGAVIDRKSPDLVDVLNMAASEEHVPNLLYSLIDGRVYRPLETEAGVFKGEPVKPGDVKKMVEELAARVLRPWMRKTTIPLRMYPSGVTEVVEAEVTDETFLATQLGRKCPICGSDRLQLETLYYERSGRSASIAACLNCLTVYRLRPDGTIEIQLPAPNAAIWRTMWERNEGKDAGHPFTEQWLDRAHELAKKRKWRLLIP